MDDGLACAFTSVLFAIHSLSCHLHPFLPTNHNSILNEAFSAVMEHVINSVQRLASSTDTAVRTPFKIPCFCWENERSWKGHVYWDTFTGTKITKSLVVPCTRSFRISWPKSSTKTIQTTPTQFIKYPTEFHFLPLPGFVEQPQAARSFNEYVLHRRIHQVTCWDMYPIE